MSEACQKSKKLGQASWRVGHLTLHPRGVYVQCLTVSGLSSSGFPKADWSLAVLITGETMLLAHIYSTCLNLREPIWCEFNDGKFNVSGIIYSLFLLTMPPLEESIHR